MGAASLGREAGALRVARPCPGPSQQASLRAGQGEEKAGARWAGPAWQAQCVSAAAAMGSAVLWRRGRPDLGRAVLGLPAHT